MHVISHWNKVIEIVTPSQRSTFVHEIRVEYSQHTYIRSELLFSCHMKIFMRYFERVFLLVWKSMWRTLLLYLHIHYTWAYIYIHMYVVSLSPAMYPCCHYHVVFKLLFQLFKKRKKAKENEKNRRIFCRRNAERLVSETNQHYNKIQNISDY